MSKTNDVPEWAMNRAVELAGFPVQVDDQDRPLPWRQSLYNAGLDAFARYIAQHEEPPVDPLLVEAREIAAVHGDWVDQKASAPKARAGEWDNNYRVKIALAALKRGMELASPRASWRTWKRS